MLPLYRFHSTVAIIGLMMSTRVSYLSSNVEQQKLTTLDMNYLNNYSEKLFRDFCLFFKKYEKMIEL